MLIHLPTMQATIADQLIDYSEPVPDPPVLLPSTEMIEESLNFTNMSEREHRDSSTSPYASIHAWADNANSSFYSPLPSMPGVSSPQPPLAIIPGSPTFSDPALSVPDEGELTPTDSMSLAGSGEEVWATRSGATSDVDMQSLDGDGISTPGSWTEVGSEVSENIIGNAVHN
jgi:hypothetical protein